MTFHSATLPGRGWLLLAAAVGASWAWASTGLAQQAPAPAEPAAPLAVETAAASEAPVDPLTIERKYIREYRVLGAKKLPPIDVEKAVYPYLGPARTAQDIEDARAALEKAYQDAGFQTVGVEIPPQSFRKGIAYLQVKENVVGRLRVKNSRFFSLNEIKRRAPGLAEGTVPNFADVTRDVVRLNQWPDRRITPELRAGVEPGTVDVDLTVKDTFPLHGSLELNNRYSADTKPLRLSVSASYANLWQLGHTLGLSYLVAPERRSDAEIYSAYYMARFPGLENFTLTLQGTKQTSDITSTSVGTINVSAPGETIGLRLNWTLPPMKEYFHSITFGVDYKHLQEDVNIAGLIQQSPLSYYPISLAYDGTWAGQGYTTLFSSTLVFGIRGAGSRSDSFDRRRFESDGNFFYLQGDLSHERDLPGKWQVYGQVQGQVSPTALVNSEQVSGGGQDTVRGYLESQVLGDSGVFGTLELRTPPLLGWWKKAGEANQWRIYGFGDVGYVSIRDALPEQEDNNSLASVGFGTRLRLWDHFNGSLDAAWPLVEQGETGVGDLRLLFRVWADF